MGRGTWIAVLVAAALATGASPAPAAVTVSTQRVAVSQPDELGRAVTLDTDLYVPGAPAPPGGRALAVVFHGGGSSKANAFDAAHARALAEHGLVSLIYSQRGHGDSDGQTAVAGPKEIRDAYDVIAWALAQPQLGIDRDRIALWGDSQGGLHTNLLAAHAGDRAVNPTGIRPRVLLPANTPDIVLDALAPDGVVKLSFGVGLVQTYGQGASGRISPLLAKWITTLALDDPLASGPRCPPTPPAAHDTLTSATRADLAWRSVGCVTPVASTPFLWAQALDDELFTPDMAIHMWRRTRARGDRLYLSVGGHATPASDPAVETDELGARIAFLDAGLAGRPESAALPPVTYWVRDPAIDVPADAFRWPPGAWKKATAPTWPPPGAMRERLALGADGRLVHRGATTSATPLAPIALDVAHDPVANTVFAATPLGTRPLPRDVEPPELPGALARFTSAPLGRARVLAGAPVLGVEWTPLSRDGQLAAKLLAVTADGRRTLLTRGIRGLRGLVPGQPRRVAMRLTTAAARLARGTRLELWVSAGDPTTFKPTPGALGGVLRSGPLSTLSVPLRSAE